LVGADFASLRWGYRSLPWIGISVAVQVGRAKLRGMAYGLHDEKPLLHRGVRVAVREVQLPRAVGAPERREVVEAADAVVVLPLLDGDRVVLIKNRRYAVNETLWELPAGTLEPGEEPAAAAPRELTEETGYAAGQIDPLTRFFPAPGFCTECLHAFRATGLQHVGQSLDATEQIEAVPTFWADALAMVRGGTIRDAKTVATLLYHQAFGRDIKR